jgi:hypothetical protein
MVIDGVLETKLGRGTVVGDWRWSREQYSRLAHPRGAIGCKQSFAAVADRGAIVVAGHQSLPRVLFSWVDAIRFREGIGRVVGVDHSQCMFHAMALCVTDSRRGTDAVGNSVGSRINVCSGASIWVWVYEEQEHGSTVAGARNIRDCVCDGWGDGFYPSDEVGKAS